MMKNNNSWIFCMTNNEKDWMKNKSKDCMRNGGEIAKIIFILFKKTQNGKTTKIMDYYESLFAYIITSWTIWNIDLILNRNQSVCFFLCNISR